ncbi:MAG: hypothetical protein R3264_03660, partial [Anaerolineae bacterium]|nr:hypothetical protein [Anaerolineae bacterium]
RYLFYRKHYPPLKVWLASQVVQWGMRRKMKQDELAEQRGQLSQVELQDRLHGYRQVIEIWRGETERRK